MFYQRLILVLLTCAVVTAQNSLEECPTLSVDSGGQQVTCVKLLQTMLNARGATPGLDVDGDFGELTDEAVRGFQTAQRLDVDGIVGPKTKAALTAPASPAQTSPGAVSCTAGEFRNAIKNASNKYPVPSSNVYDAFSRHIGDGGFSSKRELAMFLAQIIHESVGLQFKAEIKPSKGAYKNPELDKPGKQYYGRGYIQLTHSYNYKAASEALFNDDRLLDNPDLVESNEDYAWRVSFWYWKANVATVDAVKKGQFGATTKAIHGKAACTNNKYLNAAKRRYAIYVTTLTALGVNERPKEGGCYSS